MIIKGYVSNKNNRVRLHIYILLLYIFILPIGTGLEFYGISVMNYIAVFYLLSSIFVKRTWTKFNNRKNAVVLYYSFSLMSLLWSSQVDNINWYVTTFITNGLLFIFVVSDIYSDKEVKYIYKSVSNSILLIIAVTILNFSSAMNFRLSIVLNRPIDMNDFGTGLLLILSLLVYKYYNDKKKLLDIVGTAIILLILVLTGSRGALIAGIAALTFGIVGYGKGIKNKLMTLFALITMVIIFINIKDYIPAYLLHRFQLSTILLDRGAGRVGIWISALETIKNSNLFNLFFGFGFNSFGYAISPVYGYYKMSHNVFVQTLVETGLFGLIFFILAIWCIYKNSFRSEIKFITPAFIGLIVSCISLDMHVTRISGLIIALCFIRKNE